MSTTTSRRVGRSTAAVVASALGLTALATSPAHAASGTPRPDSGEGEVFLTSATTVAEGARISFVGTGFGVGATSTTPSSPVFQGVFAKLDDGYSGSAATGPNTTVGQFQVQGDGSVSGSITIPADIDDPAVNGTNDEGPHWIRLLGPNPVVTKHSDTFTVSGSAAAAPTVTATAAITSGRGGSNVVVTVDGTGFEPNESVTVSKANAAVGSTIGTALTADADGAIVDKTITVPVGGDLPAGEWQLIFNRADANDAPATAQVTVPAAIALTGAALDSDGTVTISNAQPGAKFGEVSFDPDSDPATDNDVVVTTAQLVADASGVASGAIHIPDGPANLGTKTFTASQTFPYAAAYTASAKVSPSTATFGADKFTVTKSADGAVVDGLYQSAYSARNNAVYATTAYQTQIGGTAQWDGTLYKLDPNTLAVTKSQQAPLADEATGARFAPYGVGVDDTHNTVWATNTRQNTVTVYDAATLAPIYTAPAGTVSHSRDVIYDPGTQQVYVSSASEGTSGDGYISVFEADDKDGDGTKYEKITDIATGPRTDYSPMSLALDVASHTLFSPSLSSQKVAKVDTETNTVDFVTVDGILASGRGASGIAYDAKTNRIFVASQNTDELVIADADTGATLHEIPTGAGALNVAFDPVNRLAYVANFGGSTITVVDAEGNKVANLPYPRTNHVSVDGKGNVFAVDKNTGNHVWKLTYKKPTSGGSTGTTPPPALTPLQQKILKAAAVVKKDNARIKVLKAKIKKAQKAHKAAAVKKLKKQLVKAKKKLKADKKKLAKLKKQLRRR